MARRPIIGAMKNRPAAKMRRTNWSVEAGFQGSVHSPAGHSALAFRSMESAARWGRQSCLQAAFQAAVDTEQTVRRHFSPASCLAASWSEAGEIRPETRRRAEARLQPGLAAPRKAKVQGQAKACPTNPAALSGASAAEAAPHLVV